jgi:hypothetical protein
MNGPEDEEILLDQAGACLYQPLEKHIDTSSTAHITRTASSRYATNGLTRQAPGTII